jgi:hypothetical protein
MRKVAISLICIFFLLAFSISSITVHAKEIHIITPGFIGDLPTCELWDILCWLRYTKEFSVVSTSATAKSICTVGESETTCSVSNYLSLNSGCTGCNDELTGVSIEGVGNIQAWDLLGIGYSKCKFKCTGSGYGGASFDTGWIDGSPNLDYSCSGTKCAGCYANWCKCTGYHGGNAFSTSCQAVFYNEVANLPTINCNNNGLCEPDLGEDIKCIDCQGTGQCISKWVCGDWGICSNGKQTRSCNDGCNNFKTEEQDCVEQPSEPTIPATPTEPTYPPSEPTQPPTTEKGCGWDVLCYFNNLSKYIWDRITGAR